jgi:hypothetical protein
MAAELAAAGTAAVIVVDVDHHPEPKSLLAEAAETGLRPRRRRRLWRFVEH